MANFVRLRGCSPMTKQQATDTARAVLYRHMLKMPIQFCDDVFFLEALFDSHPDRDEKAQGRMPSHFEIHPNKGGSRCFYVVFRDGTKIDFSFKKSIDAAAKPLSAFCAAACGN